MLGRFQNIPLYRQVALLWIVTALAANAIALGGLWLMAGAAGDYLQTSLLATLTAFVLGVPMSHQFCRLRVRQTRMVDQLRKTSGKLREANRTLRYKMTINTMTGLANREYFFSKFDEFRTLYQNNILMIIDADKFKAINDNYGHLAGDQALMQIVAVLKRIRRQGDFVGRIGGEEFGVLLPDTSEAEGEIIAEMIRREVERIIYVPYEGMRHVLTVSIGIASFGPDKNRVGPMHEADVALFEAKRRGRNQCLLFEVGMRDKPKPFAANAGLSKSVDALDAVSPTDI